LYTNTEIDNFAKVFFQKTKTQTNLDLAKLNSYIDPAVDKYNTLDNVQTRIEFKASLAKFLRLYSFLPHVINLGDEKLYKFYAYGKCLYRKLPKEGERVPDLNNDVTLQYYRLQKFHEGSIELAENDGVLYSTTSGLGSTVEDEQEKLSKIIAELNERLGTNFTEMDKVLEQFVQDMSQNQELVLRSKNTRDLFKIVYDNIKMDVILNRMTQNQEFCERYLEDAEFRKEVDDILLPLVHDRLSKI
jgi:type I restriction enzyme R subunit